MTQKWPQPQLVLISIAIPVRKTTRPAGAKTFSPRNAAWRATVTTLSGSFDVLARMPLIMIDTPQPTQITASRTWMALKSEYQLLKSTDDDEKAKIRPITATPPRMPYVRLFEPPPVAADSEAGVSMLRLQQVRARISRRARLAATRRRRAPCPTRTPTRPGRRRARRRGTPCAAPRRAVRETRSRRRTRVLPRR